MNHSEPFVAVPRDFIDSVAPLFKLDPSVRWTYVCLERFADFKTGVADVTIAQLVGISGVEERQLHRNLATLYKSGVVSRVERPGKKNQFFLKRGVSPMTGVKARGVSPMTGGDVTHDTPNKEAELFQRGGGAPTAFSLACALCSTLKLVPQPAFLRLLELAIKAAADRYSESLPDAAEHLKKLYLAALEHGVFQNTSPHLWFGDATKWEAQPKENTHGKRPNRSQRSPVDEAIRIVRESYRGVGTADGYAAGNNKTGAHHARQIRGFSG